MPSKRKQIQKYCNEKVVPNKGNILRRVITTGGFYIITNPAVALAVNATDIAEGYAIIAENCLAGRRLGFLPVPTSYMNGALCAALLLTCGAGAV